MPIDGRVGLFQTQRVSYGQLEADQSSTGTSASTAALVGAVTLNSPYGVVTSDSITIPAGMAYNLTITNSLVLSVSDQVVCTVQSGTSTGGIPAIASVTPSVGAVTIGIANVSTTGTSGIVQGALKVTFNVINNNTGLP